MSVYPVPPCFPAANLKPLEVVARQTPVQGIFRIRSGPCIWADGWSPNPQYLNRSGTCLVRNLSKLTPPYLLPHPEPWPPSHLPSLSGLHCPNIIGGLVSQLYEGYPGRMRSSVLTPEISSIYCVMLGRALWFATNPGKASQLSLRWEQHSPTSYMDFPLNAAICSLRVASL